MTQLLLLDIVPSGGALVAGAVGVGVFFILLAAGLIFFVLAQRTVKLAVRMTILAVLLFLAVGGSIALMLYGYIGTPTRRPEPRRVR